MQDIEASATVKLEPTGIRVTIFLSNHTGETVDIQFRQPLIETISESQLSTASADRDVWEIRADSLTTSVTLAHRENVERVYHIDNVSKRRLTAMLDEAVIDVYDLSRAKIGTQQGVFARFVGRADDEDELDLAAITTEESTRSAAADTGGTDGETGGGVLTFDELMTAEPETESTDSVETAASAESETAAETTTQPPSETPETDRLPTTPHEYVLSKLVDDIEPQELSWSELDTPEPEPEPDTTDRVGVIETVRSWF